MSTQHTYLRYECADSFGLVTATGSSQAPATHHNIAAVSLSSSNNVTGGQTSNLVWTTAGSACHLWNLKTNTLQKKLGHFRSTPIGTGRALNSDEVVCLDQGGLYVATGWTDGSVRVFEISSEDYHQPKRSMLAHSLLVDHSDAKTTNLWQDPLTLQGHSSSVRVVALEKPASNTDNSTAVVISRLASGSSDGVVIVWDLITERGLFRLTGHRGGITDIIFLSFENKSDLLMTCSLDGLIKVWDLKVQYCIQTIAHHQGSVWCASIHTDNNTNSNGGRIRLLTSGHDGLVRVWDVKPSQRMQEQALLKGNSSADIIDTEDVIASDDTNNETAKDDVCSFMGTLLVPPNVVVSNERLACLCFRGKYVGVLHANARNLEIYIHRSPEESLRKKQRRLKRRQEKAKKNENQTKEKNSKKRGILDDDDDDLEADNDANATGSNNLNAALPIDMINASDEFEYIASVRASHKIKSFVLMPASATTTNEVLRVVCSLSTNSIESYCIRKAGSDTEIVWEAALVTKLDMYGHPTGIRSIALASDDSVACTVSKNVIKLWNVTTRSVISSIVPDLSSKQQTMYGLCAAFLPGNNHVICGTREGHLLVLDVAAGEIVAFEEKAHDGAIWSVDVRKPTSVDPTAAILTGSADKTVKFWDLEIIQDDEKHQSPTLSHTRTLQMNDDVVAARYSYSMDPSKRMVFVATLDSTIKVFFDDSLKLFLSLYGHKLPVLSIDASDDDVLLVSSGADKTIKIWGLDFGDTHRTLHGHEDSITDVRFVRRTHNFFSTSKDGSVRFWDGDRFEQILLLNGHFGEVNCLAISRTGAFVLTGGMDRQVRVWERTKDIVFLEEERERELEATFDKLNDRDEKDTLNILSKNVEGEDDGIADDQPQSEAAIKKSVLSVAAGDRIIEALELADTEQREIDTFRKTHGTKKEKASNPLLLNMTTHDYVLWVLQSVKHAEVEQGLLMLPLSHVERLLFYLIKCLKTGQGTETCAHVSTFLVKIHQDQLIANKSLRIPLKEMRRLLRLRLSEMRDMIGYDLAALKLAGRVAAERKSSLRLPDTDNVDIWAGMGLGSDVAAAIQARGRKRS